VTDLPDQGDANRWGGGSRPRQRSSLTIQVFAILAASLLAGTIAAALVDARLTRASLADEARRQIRAEAQGAESAIVSRTSRQSTILRAGARAVGLRDAILDRDRPRILTAIVGLSEDAATASLAILAADISLQVGDPLRPLPPEVLDRSQVLLWRFADGRVARVIVEALRESNAVLVAATPFGDAQARELRTVLGRQVILVVDGQIVGATFTHQGGDAPGLGADGALPAQELLVEVAGSSSYLAYQGLTDGAADQSLTGAVGVAAADPIRALDASLARGRVIGLGLLVAAAVGLSSLLVRFVTRPARLLADTAQRVADGDLGAEFSDVPGGELGDLAAALDRMRRTLQDQVLIMGDQADALRGASERLVNVRDADRRRLAQGLHDGLQQRLVLLRMRLQTLPEQELGPQRSRLAEEIRGLLVELREISHDLYPSILLDRGPAGALRSLAGRSPIPITVTVEPEPLPRLDPEVEANAYFLAAEAITNALKYAEASRIDVRIDLVGDVVHVRVVDDGRGFPESAEGGMGLRNMQDRALAFHGHCDVTSDASGTRVDAVFSLPGSAALEEDQDGRDPSIEVIRVR